ncbi:MAG: thioredoxin family protein [Acidiferrobacterales bacterium]|nr:thioredoxin family protein [Acidiferrobacterales bacterium]
MAETASNMLELGTRAPQFTLPNTNPIVPAKRVSLTDFERSRAIVIAFICNHCPYVVHIKTALSDFAREYADKGISVIAISANDVVSHPQDGPEQMGSDAVRYDYIFPYLYDETQEVAKAYDAACTPDIYLFGPDLRLVYRGQFDSSRPGNQIPVTGEDLRNAADALLAGAAISSKQVPSVGCNIKWRNPD